MSRQGSLSDDALAQLLQVLEAHFPKAVGLDIYRDFKATPALAALLQKQDQFVAVCKVSAPKDDPGVEPPPELTPEQLGFSDVVTDLSDNVLRRHLLTMGEIQPDSLCGAQEAFSLKLALNYLAAQGIFPERKTPEQHLKLDRTVFAPLSPVQNGGYNSWDRRTEGGEQILLNYRSSMNDIARRVHLSELLKGGEVLKLIEGRVVLIGVTAPSQKDDFVTPYSTSNAPDQRIRGIMLQAQMVSQILSAVLDNRPLIWVWPMWGEVIWIGSWSLMGGLLAWQVRSHRRLMFWAAIAVLTLACLCGLIFLVGGWVPLIPCGLVLVSSSIMISAREKRV
jgi:CHASE2 domain-containing sensor protein